MEGVKASVSFFPPDEAVRAVAGAHGGGKINGKIYSKNAVSVPQKK